MTKLILFACVCALASARAQEMTVDLVVPLTVTKTVTTTTEVNKVTVDYIVIRPDERLLEVSFVEKVEPIKFKMTESQWLAFLNTCDKHFGDMVNPVANEHFARLKTEADAKSEAQNKQ